MMRQRIPGRERGFLIIAAVFLLVVLAGLVAYLMTVSTTSQAASAADFNTARAYQAARAGIEWGAYQVLRDPTGPYATTTCNAGTPVDLTFGPFNATVTCTRSASLTEGASTTVRAYRIKSNACNQPSPSCPTVTTSGTYVERELELSITN